MTDDYEFIDIDPKQGLESAFEEAKKRLDAGTNMPVALRIKRKHATFLEDIYTPDYSERYLAGIKTVLRRLAKDDKKFRVVLESYPHIFGGDNDYSSPELEENIIIPVGLDTSFSDVRVSIYDDLELCDTIALTQLHDGHYSDEIPKIINLVYESVFDQALEKIKKARQDKQALVKFSPEAQDWKDTDKIADWLHRGIDISYQYARRDALFLQLPEEKTPNQHGFSCPYLWIEDHAGNRIRPEHLFLVMRPNDNGREALHFNDFVVKGFDLGVPISFTNDEFQERLEDSMRNSFGIEIDDDFSDWKAVEKFKGAKKDVTVFSSADIQEAHKTMIMVYMYGQKRGINVLDALKNLNRFIAERMPQKIEPPSMPAKPHPSLPQLRR